MNIIITEAERHHLIQKLTTRIEHRQAIIDDPDAKRLGCNIAAITSKLQIEKSILVKLQK
jgi:hypothetical protein